MPAQLQVVDDPPVEHVADVGAVGNVEARIELLGPDAAADPLDALEDEDLQAFLREVVGGDQPVVAGPHEDASYSVSAIPSLPSVEPPSPPGPASSSGSDYARSCLTSLDERRHDGPGIADRPEGGHPEDVRVRVAIDRDDRLRPRDPGHVLDGAGDPDRDVQLGRHARARQAHLVDRGHPAEIGDRTASRPPPRPARPPPPRRDASAPRRPPRARRRRRPGRPSAGVRPAALGRLLQHAHPRRGRRRPRGGTIRPTAPGVAASYAPARIVAICGVPRTTYSAVDAATVHRLRHHDLTRRRRRAGRNP